jgi:putative ABC transport system permease protein
MESVYRDIRYAFQSLGREPGFTAAVVITLALGIGANTAIFSALHAVVLKPLPFDDPDRLVMVWDSVMEESRQDYRVTLPNFEDWREQNTVFEMIAAFRGSGFTLMGVDEPELISGASVSADFFRLVGVEAALGRTFLPEEDRAGGPEVAVLSDGLWRRKFGADPELIGRTVNLDGTAYTVVGVLPPNFDFPVEISGAQVWTPVSLVMPFAVKRGVHTFLTVARLKPGITRKQAQAEMDTIARRLEEQYPETNEELGAYVMFLHDHLVGQARPILLMLLGAVALVLLIACANVANMLLARFESRRREFAVRGALGAGRLRLIRQLLTESLLLGLLGGAFGVLLAAWGIEALAAMIPADMPRSDEIGLNGFVLFFAFALALCASLLFGLLPALHAAPSNLPASLKGGGRDGSGGGRRRLRGAIVVSEIALALVLLIGAGLLFRSLHRLMSVDPGFNPENVLTFGVWLPDSQDFNADRRAQVYAQVLERVGTLPSVLSAGAITTLPLTTSNLSLGFQIQGRPSQDPSEGYVARYGSVSTDYFQTIGMSLVRGRWFTEHDTRGRPGVMIINEAMARRFWPAEDPFGQRVKIKPRDDSDPEDFEIVGIVSDIRESILDEPVPYMYVPMRQQTWHLMAFALRTAGDPASLIGAVRREVAAVTRKAAPSRVGSLEQHLDEAWATRRFTTILLSLYSAVALILAALGIYGVLSYSVAQRTHEIGVRMAVGAQRRDILAFVLKRGLALTAGGVAIGLIAAAAGSHVLTSLLFETSAVDPATFAGVSLLLVAVATIACNIPARRATRVDPMVALRHE